MRIYVCVEKYPCMYVNSFVCIHIYTPLCVCVWGWVFVCVVVVVVLAVVVNVRVCKTIGIYSCTMHVFFKYKKIKYLEIQDAKFSSISLIDLLMPVYVSLENGRFINERSIDNGFTRWTTLDWQSSVFLSEYLHNTKVNI